MESGSLPFRMQQSAAWLLDRRYHLDTAATVSRDKSLAETARALRAFQMAYAHRCPLHWRWATSDDMFADIGSGKGRIVVRASRSL